MQDITSIKNVLIPSKFLQNVNATKLNLYNYISSVLTQMGIGPVTPTVAPYKVYRFIATFTGGVLQPITVLENTLGYNPTVVRIGVGTLRINAANFPNDANKLYITATGSRNNDFATFTTHSSNTFVVKGFIQDATTKDMIISDDAFNRVFVEIQVYP